MSRGRWHDAGETGEQVERRHDDVGGAVLPRSLEPKANAVITKPLDAVVAQRATELSCRLESAGPDEEWDEVRAARDWETHQPAPPDPEAGDSGPTTTVEMARALIRAAYDERRAALQ